VDEIVSGEVKLSSPNGAVLVVQAESDPVFNPALIAAFMRTRAAEASATSESPTAPPTFRSVFERWFSGDLAESYPDHVDAKDSGPSDKQRVEVLARVLGDLRVDDPNWLTRADDAMSVGLEFPNLRPGKGGLFLEFRPPGRSCVADVG
jgi:hypothetical protein